MSMEHTDSAVCFSNNKNVTHDNTSSSDNEVNCKSHTKRHIDLKKIMQTCNSAEEMDMPTSAIGDIKFMKDLVSEYFAEAFPLLERSKKEIKELRKIENIAYINQQNVKHSSFEVKQEYQQEESRSSFSSLWKALHTISVLSKSREGNKHLHSDITPSFTSFSVNLQPPTVTSTEVDHFLSTLNDEDKAILLREYDQFTKHNMEYILESEENITMCKINKNKEHDHKHNFIKDEKMSLCNASENLSADNNMHIDNIAIERENIGVNNVHKEGEECKEICTNEKDSDSNMSTQAVNHTVQMESEDSMSRYKKAWFTEPDDNKTSVNFETNKNDNMSSNIYEKEDKKTNIEVQELHADNSNASIQENENMNNERKKKENEYNAKQEYNNRKESDDEWKNPLHVDHIESELEEEIDEQKSEESDTVSLEESFDQFSRRLLARDEWAKNLHPSEQNTQRSNVVNFFEHVNMTATPYSLESQKQSHVKWERSEEEEWEEEPYELLEENEFVIPSTELFSSQQKSHVQQKKNVQRCESQNKSDAINDGSNRKESAQLQNSLLLSSSHINTDAKVEQDLLPEANKTLQNKNNSKGLKKMTKSEPLCETNKSQGWRSYLSNMVTRKDANKERDYCNKCDNTTKRKETSINILRQSAEWNKCINSDATQVQHMTRAQNAYLRKRAYDILLANKVRKHDEQMYIAYLHRTMQEQAQLLVHSMLPLIHQLSHLVRQSCSLLDVVAELDRAAFGACVVSPSQYLTSPRFRLCCAEITCQAGFSTTVTRITCRRCGEVYCPRCCTERGIGPDVMCARPRSLHHTRNITKQNNNFNSTNSNKSGNINYHAFLLQASTSDRHNVDDQEHRDNNSVYSDATSAENKTQTNVSSQFSHYTSISSNSTFEMQESRCKESEQYEHISLGWEPICMRCWRVCAENVKRVAMERRRRSLVHQTHTNNNNYYGSNNGCKNVSTCAKKQSNKVKVNRDDDDNDECDDIENKLDDKKYHNTSTPVSNASGQAHSYHSSSTLQSTLPTSHHSISLEELSVKEAVLLGAYCDKELRLHDGFAPFYVMTDCNNDTVASWDVIAYKLARVGSAWRTHWQDAGKWAAVALHYTRLQAQLRIANLRTQVKWRELLQNFKQGALSTKKLLLKENRHLPRIVHRINKGAHAVQSSKETGSHKQRNGEACNDSKKNNKDSVVEEGDDNDDDYDFVEDDYDEATLLNFFNRSLEDGTISDYTYSSHIMTS